MKLYYNIITEYDWNSKTCIIIIIVQVLEPDDGIISQPFHSHRFPLTSAILYFYHTCLPYLL
jgi:hypothetical protein